MQPLLYLRNITAVAYRSPSEFVDRISGQLQIRREARLRRPNYKAVQSGGIADIMDDPAELDTLRAEFEAVWTAVAETLSSSQHVLGKGYDAGRALAEWSYLVVRAARPMTVVETGVARGITSRVILEAMEANQSGHLFSIDLPPTNTGWFAESAAAVVPKLQPRWTYIRGASRRHLPGLFARLGPVPMFVHDSLHTYANMTWELETAWQNVVTGGYIICDDIEDNCAFADFVSRYKPRYVIAKEPFRSGFIGAMRR